MKKTVSLFLVFIMIFGVAAIGITTAPHVHAEETQQTYTEGNFVYEIVNDDVIIIDYTDKESTAEIVIPDSLGGYPVTELAADSFKGCQCTAVTIPASITSIDVEAFAYDMPNIESYTVVADNPQYSSENGILYSGTSSYKTLFAYPKNAPDETLDLLVVDIAPFAFSQVKNLKSITLASPSNYTTCNIQKYAFYNATSLESVTMTRYIDSIGDYAFASCPSLESVSISDTVENLGWGIFEDTPFIDNIEKYDDDGVLYLGVNLIATKPFGDKEYYEIIPGTTAIAGGAFEWNSLKKVYLPASVEYIESNPFAKCPNLETFTFHSEGIFKIDKYGVLFNDDSLIAYPNGIYRSCYYIEPIINRHSILPYAFYLSPIRNIYIPSNELSYKHLGYCSLGDVTDVHFAGLETAWNNMRYVKERYEPTKTAEYDDATIHFNSLGISGHEIVSDNSVQSVCSCGYTAKHDSANSNATADGFVYEIVNKKMVITGYKFKESTSALVIPETIEGYPVTKIEKGAFNNCMFTSVQIPANVTEIDREAFAYTPNNQSFTVASGNQNFEAIDGVLFKKGSVKALFAYPQNAPATEYQQPAQPIEILPYAFYGSKNLKTLSSWKSVTVQDYAFLNSSIESFTDSEFDRIGSGAFKNSKLNEFSVTSTPGFFGYNAFEGTPFLENAVYDEDGVFYHGNILVATQKEADKTYYKIKDGTTVVAGGAFVWSSLEEVYLPESLEVVNGSAFTHATALKTFTLDSNNKHFGIYDGIALYNISRTKLIALPPAVEMGCYGIYDGVEEISAFAFNNTRRICCVHVPSSVRVIGEFAFGATKFGHIQVVKYQGAEVFWNSIEITESGLDMTDYITSISKVYNVPLEGHASKSIVKTTEGSTVCTKIDITTYTCACGCSWYFKTTPKGHVPEDEYTVTKSPTCTGTGTKVRYCTVCGNAAVTTTIPALGHDYELIEHIEPTCTENGKNKYKCTRCNTKKTEDAEAALGHTSSGKTVKTEPTCTEDGGLYNVCDRCDKTIYDECLEVYPATGHTEGEWICTQEPTCTYQRIDTLYCSVCNQVIETKTGDYGTHIYIEDFYENCTYKVVWVYCDGGCGYEELVEEVEAPDDAILGEDESGLGHTVELITIEPTCRRRGYSYYKCTVCEDRVGDYFNRTEKLEHNLERVTAYEPTCYEEGLIEIYCTNSNCAYYDEEYLPMLPHTFDEWKYEDGNLFSGVCTVCEEEFDQLEVVLYTEEELTLENQSTEEFWFDISENITDDFVFESSDSSIVEVSSDGILTAKAPGTAVVTVKINGTEISAQCEVTVTPRTYLVEWFANGELIYLRNIAEGSEIEVPDDPEILGLNFAGWSPEVPETMPSHDLTFTAVYYNVIQSAEYDVSATYLPGCYSEEITLDVAEIKGEREPGGVYMVEGEYYKQIGLYNIKTVNESGEVVQPVNGYKVTVRIAIPETYKNQTTFMIYHRFTGGGREQLSTANGTLRIESGYLVFEVSKFSEFEIFVPAPYIKITQLPDTTVYYYNTVKELDLTGLRIKYVKADGTTKTLTEISPITVEGFDSTKVGTQTITVKYGQCSDTFEVTVKYNWWQWIIYVLFGWLMR